MGLRTATVSPPSSPVIVTILAYIDGPSVSRNEKHHKTVDVRLT
jgi:hypothetical protein